MEYLAKRLSAQYPDIAIIQEMYGELTAKTGLDSVESGDTKYRPLPLMLGVLYRLQARQDSFFNECGEEVISQGEDILHLLGYYWHQQHTMGKCLREGMDKITDHQELVRKIRENTVKMAQTLELGVELLPVVSVSELCKKEVTTTGQMVQQQSLSSQCRLEEHCPDFVISLDLPRRAVVLTIFGTRMFPKPHPQDVIMDLAARSTPFLDGEAHSGMATGCRNLEYWALPSLIKQLSLHQGFSLLVVGYSLGAGLAQLFTLSLEQEHIKKQFPHDTKVRAICFGCPPVFTRRSCSPPLPGNILAVSNDTDGITGASFRNINHLFLKVRALHQLGLKRRTLIKLAFGRGDNNVGTEVEAAMEALGDDVSVDLEEEQTTKKTGFLARARDSVRGAMNKGPTISEAWDQVEQSMASLPPVHHPNLNITTDRLLVLRRRKEKVAGVGGAVRKRKKVRLRMYSKQEHVNKFSDNLRLKYGMFDNHMPWGYNNLFQEYGVTELPDSLKLDLLDKERLEMNLQPDPEQEEEEEEEWDIMEKAQVEEKMTANSSRLYPDLSELM